MDIKLTHPNEEQTIEMLGLQGYKFLGWQRNSENCEDIKKCYDNGHRGEEIKDGNAFLGKRMISVKVHDRQQDMRGSNCTYWCEECKHFWKIDMSD